MGSPARPARLSTRSHQTLVMLISYNQHCHDRRHQKPTDKIFLSTCIKYFSASGAGQGSIDHRIEQAMDLVKSHLMAAVRTEVDELRDKISKLEDTVSFLSRENEFLRAHVSPEVLSNVPRSLPGVLPGVLPDTSASHPALQSQSTTGQSHS